MEELLLQLSPLFGFAVAIKFFLDPVGGFIDELQETYLPKKVWMAIASTLFGIFISIAWGLEVLPTVGPEWIPSWLYTTMQVVATGVALGRLSNLSNDVLERIRRG